MLTKIATWLVRALVKCAFDISIAPSTVSAISGICLSIASTSRKRRDASEPTIVGQSYVQKWFSHFVKLKTQHYKAVDDEMQWFTELHLQSIFWWVWLYCSQCFTKHNMMHLQCDWVPVVCCTLAVRQAILILFCLTLLSSTIFSKFTHSFVPPQRPCTYTYVTKTCSQT